MRGTVENCYNTGTVNGKVGIAGIAGQTGLKDNIIKNCYVIGNIVSTSNQYSAILGRINPENGGSECSFYNNYNLENIVNGANCEETVNGISIKTSQEMKNISELLGSKYKQDTNNINNGYPILSWQ